MSVIEAPAPTVTAPAITKADVLIRAADLLEEFGWCQHALARTDTNTPLTTEPDSAITDPKWTSFCVLGAVMRARYDLGVSEFFAPSPISAMWNNEPGRTKAEVVARLRDAAQAARETT